MFADLETVIAGYTLVDIVLLDFDASWEPIGRTHTRALKASYSLAY